MDRPRQFVHCRLELAAHHELGDQLTRLRPHQVSAEQLPALRPPDDLDEPIGLARGPRPFPGEDATMAPRLRSRATASVRPTNATSGWQYVTAGTVA